MFLCICYKKKYLHNLLTFLRVLNAIKTMSVSYSSLSSGKIAKSLSAIGNLSVKSSVHSVLGSLRILMVLDSIESMNESRLNPIHGRSPVL